MTEGGKRDIDGVLRTGPAGRPRVRTTDDGSGVRDGAGKSAGSDPVGEALRREYHEKLEELLRVTAEAVRPGVSPKPAPAVLWPRPGRRPASPGPDRERPPADASTADVPRGVGAFLYGARFRRALVGVIVLAVVVVAGVYAFDTLRAAWLREKVLDARQHREVVKAAADYRAHRPDDMEVVYLSALANIGLGDFTAAVADLRQLAEGAASLGGADADAHFYQAMIAYPDVPRSLGHLERVLVAEPDHVPARLLRALYSHSRASGVPEGDRAAHIAGIYGIDLAGIAPHAPQIRVMFHYLMETAAEVFPGIAATIPHGFGLDGKPGVLAGFLGEFGLDASGMVRDGEELDPAVATDIMRLAASMLGARRQDTGEQGYAQALLDAHAADGRQILAAYLAAVHKARVGDLKAALRLFAVIESELGRPATDSTLLTGMATARMLLDPAAHLTAIRDYSRAIAIDTGNAVALNNRGFLEMWLNKDLGKARRDFAAALESSPDGLAAAYNMAHAHHRSGEYADAVRLFGQVAAADPLFGNVYLYQGLANRELGRHGPAIEDFTRLKTQYPGSVDPYIEIARTHAQGGGHELAVRELQAAHTLRPDDRGVATFLADQYLLSGQPLLAKRLIDDLVAETPDDIRVGVLNGRLLLAQGDPGAERVLRDAYERHKGEGVGKRVEVAAHYIDALVLNGRHDEAIALVRGLLSKAPGHIGLRKRLPLLQGDIHAKSGNFSEAIQWYETAHKTWPNDLAPLLRLEGVYERSGQEESLRKTRERIRRVEGQ